MKNEIIRCSAALQVCYPVACGGVFDLPISIRVSKNYSKRIIYETEQGQIPRFFGRRKLSGGCEWQEDEGLHCLIKNGHVVYMGSWNDEDVWDERLLNDDNYLSNYVLYPKREELRQKLQSG